MTNKITNDKELFTALNAGNTIMFGKSLKELKGPSTDIEETVLDEIRNSYSLGYVFISSGDEMLDFYYSKTQADYNRIFGEPDKQVRYVMINGIAVQYSHCYPAGIAHETQWRDCNYLGSVKEENIVPLKVKSFLPRRHSSLDEKPFLSKWHSSLNGVEAKGVICDIGDGQTDLIYSYIWMDYSVYFLVGKKNKRYDPAIPVPID